MLVAVCIGLFIYSIGAVIQAAAMDVTPEQAGAMTIGLLFGSSFLFTTPSPTIAGALASAFGTPSVFLYSGSLILLSAVIVSFLPIRGARRASET
jgi:sugar phosphate permease